ncbi:MAG: CRISPR-associated protein Cas4 [Candidatus Woesearchaeota archaeon]|nr:CRISPR-associated protein Cas4 [Candidatus Woesearchaeota archaeon]
MYTITSLSEFLYCPRKLYLKTIFKPEIPLTDKLVKGNIKHKIFEKINNVEEDIIKNLTQPLPIEQINMIYLRKYHNIVLDVLQYKKDILFKLNIDLNKFIYELWPIFINEAKSHSINIYNFMIKNNLYGEDLWNRLTPKFITELQISSNELQLKGIVDKIEINNNNYIPYELKSGRLPDDIYYNHKIQLAGYSLLLENKFKILIPKGYVQYIDHDITKEVQINQELKDDVIKIRDSISFMFTNNLIPEILQNNKCFNCELKEQCHNFK